MSKAGSGSASAIILKGCFATGEPWTIEAAPLGPGNREILFFSGLAVGALQQFFDSERRTAYHAIAREIYKNNLKTHGIRFTKGEHECLFVRACSFQNDKGLTTDHVFRRVCDGLAFLAVDPTIPSVATYPGRDSFLFWTGAIVTIAVKLYGDR